MDDARTSCCEPRYVVHALSSYRTLDWWTWWQLFILLMGRTFAGTDSGHGLHRNLAWPQHPLPLTMKATIQPLRCSNSAIWTTLINQTSNINSYWVGISCLPSCGPILTRGQATGVKTSRTEQIGRRWAKNMALIWLSWTNPICEYLSFVIILIEVYSDTTGFPLPTSQSIAGGRWYLIWTKQESLAIMAQSTHLKVSRRQSSWGVNSRLFQIWSIETHTKVSDTFWAWGRLE